MRLGPPRPRPEEPEHPFVGSLEYQGVTLDLEQRPGDIRRGVSPEGEPWSVRMPHYYGEVRGTTGADGDAVDVIVLKKSDPFAPFVYVIQAKLPGRKSFDETKSVLGASSKAEAVAAFRSMYTVPGFYQGCTRWPVGAWVAAMLRGGRTQRGQMRKPLRKASLNLDHLAQLVKARVKPHLRRSSSGKVSMVMEHERRVPAAKPEGYEADLHAHEDAIRHQREEHGALFAGGRWHTCGPEDTRAHLAQHPRPGKSPRNMLYIPARMLRAVDADPDAVTVHNHPSGLPPSANDFLAAIEQDVAEMRVTSPEGGSWVVRRPERGWPAGDEYLRFRQDLERLTQAAYNRAYFRLADYMMSQGGDPNAEDPMAEPGFDRGILKGYQGQEALDSYRYLARQHGIAIEYEHRGPATRRRLSDRRLAAGVHRAACEAADRAVAAFEADMGEEPMTKGVSIDLARLSALVKAEQPSLFGDLPGRRPMAPAPDKPPEAQAPKAGHPVRRNRITLARAPKGTVMMMPGTRIGWRKMGDGPNAKWGPLEPFKLPSQRMDPNAPTYWADTSTSPLGTGAITAGQLATQIKQAPEGQPYVYLDRDSHLQRKGLNWSRGGQEYRSLQDAIDKTNPVSSSSPDTRGVRERAQQSVNDATLEHATALEVQRMRGWGDSKLQGYVDRRPGDGVLADHAAVELERRAGLPDAEARRGAHPHDYYRLPLTALQRAAWMAAEDEPPVSDTGAKVMARGIRIPTPNYGMALEAAGAMQAKGAKGPWGNIVERLERADPLRRVTDETPRERAIGAVAGAKVRQLERAGFEVFEGQSTQEDREAAMGVASLGVLNKLAKKGLGVRPTAAMRSVASDSPVQPRYAAYARANGRTPDEQLAHDKRNGGVMLNYGPWVRGELNAWRKGQGIESESNLTDEQHDAFTAHLEGKYPDEPAAPVPITGPDAVELPKAPKGQNAHSVIHEDGEVQTRNSKRQYTHAVVVRVGDEKPGVWRWSSSQNAAEKYARSLDGKEITGGVARASVVPLEDGHADLRPQEEEPAPPAMDPSDHEVVELVETPVQVRPHLRVSKTGKVSAVAGHQSTRKKRLTPAQARKKYRPELREIIAAGGPDAEVAQAELDRRAARRKGKGKKGGRKKAPARAPARTTTRSRKKATEWTPEEAAAAPDRELTPAQARRLIASARKKGQSLIAKGEERSGYGNENTPRRAAMGANRREAARAQIAWGNRLLTLADKIERGEHTPTAFDSEMVKNPDEARSLAYRMSRSRETGAGRTWRPRAGEWIHDPGFAEMPTSDWAKERAGDKAQDLVQRWNTAAREKVLPVLRKYGRYDNDMGKWLLAPHPEAAKLFGEGIKEMSAIKKEAEALRWHGFPSTYGLTDVARDMRKNIAMGFVRDSDAPTVEARWQRFIAATESSAPAADTRPPWRQPPDRSRTSDDESRRAYAAELEAGRFKDPAHQRIAGFFPTPYPEVAEAVERLDVEPGMTVFEPSAGTGSMADMLPEGVEIVTAEVSPTLREVLKDKGYDPHSDYREVGDQFDRVIMNPPFEQAQDIDHVMDVFEDNLKPGGRLVAIVSSGALANSRNKNANFRAFVDEYRTEQDRAIDPKAWKKSGTQVGTVMLTLEKPHDWTPATAVRGADDRMAKAVLDLDRLARLIAA